MLTSNLRTIELTLRVAAGLLLVIALVVATSRADEPSQRAEDSADLTAQAEPAATAATARDGVSAPAAAPAATKPSPREAIPVSPASTTAPAPRSNGITADGPVVPVPVGRYRYREVFERGPPAGTTTYERTFTTTAVAPDVRWELHLQYSNGGDFTELVLRRVGDELVVDSRRVVTQFGEATCRWQPPLMVRSLRASAAKEWTGTTRCTETLRTGRGSLQDEVSISLQGRIARVFREGARGEGPAMVEIHVQSVERKQGKTRAAVKQLVGSEVYEVDTGVLVRGRAETTLWEEENGVEKDPSRRTRMATTLELLERER